MFPAPGLRTIMILQLISSYGQQFCRLCGSHMAVADTNRLAGAVNIGHFVHISVLLCIFKNLHHFFKGSLAPPAESSVQPFPGAVPPMS